MVCKKTKERIDNIGERLAKYATSCSTIRMLGKADISEPILTKKIFLFPVMN